MLDGPCDIVLSTGRKPLHSNLLFRQNVLHGTQPPPPAVVRRTPQGLPSPAAQRDRRLSMTKRKDVQPRTKEPVVETGYDLSGHVQRMTDKCMTGVTEYGLRATTSATTVTDNSDSELRAVQFALGSYLGRLRDLYETFSIDCGGPAIVYRTLMTRLGLWRMLMDCGLHARLSLAKFDELLCKYTQVCPHLPIILVFGGSANKKIRKKKVLDNEDGCVILEKREVKNIDT